MRYDYLFCSAVALFPPVGRDCPGPNEGGATRLPEPRALNGATVEDLLARMTLEEKVAQMLCLWNAKKQITEPRGVSTHPCAAVVPGGDRPDRAPQRRPRGAGGGGVHQRDPTVGEGKHASRHPRDLPRGGAARVARGRRRPASRRRSPWRAPGTRTWWSGSSPWSRGRCGPGAPSRCSPRWWTWPATRAGARFEETYGEDPYLVARMGLAAVRRPSRGRPDDPGRARDRHAEAHDRSRPAGVRDERGPGSLGERALRDVFFPTVRSGCEAGARPQPDALVQRDRRYPLARQRLDAPRRAAGRVGLRRHDRLGLAGHQPTRQSSSCGHGRCRRGAKRWRPPWTWNSRTWRRIPPWSSRYRRGKCREAAINDAVRRLLREKFELGLFEDPYRGPRPCRRDLRSAESRTLALEAARRRSCSSRTGVAGSPYTPISCAGWR